jgi:SAM-dependent methyltransferase
MKSRVEKAVTSEAFWDDYWKSLTVPVQYDDAFSNDRAIGDIIRRFVPPCDDFSKKAIEIGCAPGKWMLFLLKMSGYTVHGCEYLKSGAEKTEQNFEHFRIPRERYRVLRGDFFTIELDQNYDVVLSLGFVEHFTDFAGTMNKHLALLKPGGLLVVGLPRFVGVNWILQAVIDLFTGERMRRYLPVHNLSIMNLHAFASFAANSGCELLFNDFVGGFETALFPVNNIRVRKVRALVNRTISFVSKMKWFQNGRFVASYQMCVLRKR